MKTLTLPAGFPATTRYTLLSRLQDWDDQESWKVFFDTYWRLIYSVAMRSGLTESEAQDVVQETIISVAKDIHRFKRDRTLGTFKGWLRKIAHWRIADQFKKRTLAEPEEDAADLDAIPDPGGTDLEVLWENEWQANLFQAAIDRVKRRVKEEHYQMFNLYAVKQMSVTEVARTFGVTIGQVYLAKHRVSALIKKEIQSLEETQR